MRTINVFSIYGVISDIFNIDPHSAATEIKKISSETETRILRDRDQVDEIYFTYELYLFLFKISKNKLSTICLSFLESSD